MQSLILHNEVLGFALRCCCSRICKFCINVYLVPYFTCIHKTSLSIQARDLSKYKPGWMRNPTLVALHEAVNGGNTKSGIVGGNEATPHSHPHQVALFIDDMYFCGGSLICKQAKSLD